MQILQLGERENRHRCTKVKAKRDEAMMKQK
jgi:hypothetical protein